MSFTPLNALRAFVVVARKRNFARAARELAVSPSALSQSVKQLEVRLGVPLLARTTRSVALTDAGQRLLEQAGPAVDQAMEALKHATAQSGEVTGRVRLTVPPIAVKHVIEPLVPRFVEQYPQVEVEIHCDNRRVDIVAEGYDAGVRLEEFLERDMVTLRLSREARFVVVASSAYLERRGAPARPEDLLLHDCICFRSPTTGAIFPWDLERGKKLWHVPVRGPVVSNSEGASLALARAGVGLYYAFEPDIAGELERGELEIVLDAYAARVPGFFLYYPNRARVSPAFRAFIELARVHCSRRGKGGSP